jgi:hypothetical protein
VTEFQKQPSIIKKISPQDFGDTKDEMPVGDGLDDLLTEPFPEFKKELIPVSINFLIR